jgi:hypothetical protein
VPLTDISHLGRLIRTEDGNTVMEWRKPCHGHQFGCTCGCKPVAEIVRFPRQPRQPWDIKRAA